jgi:nitrite reductase (NADH) small subunit
VNLVHFDLDNHNWLSIGDRDYFVLSTMGKQTLLPDRCPHRGGPLHLGTWDSCRNGIICPWHQSFVSLRMLMREAPAAVRTRRQLTVVMDGDAERVLRKRCYTDTLGTEWKTPSGNGEDGGPIAPPGERTPAMAKYGNGGQGGRMWEAETSVPKA